VELGEVHRSFDLTARLEASGEAGLRLVTAADDSEYLDIRLDPAAGRLVVDRDRASLDTRAHGGSYRMPCPSDQPVELRVVVDHSIAEVFLSTGQALTLRFYPVGDGPWRLQARTAPGARLGFTVDAWELLPLEIKEPAVDAADLEGCPA
jgi:beta-fructofuranosidase